MRSLIVLLSVLALVVTSSALASEPQQSAYLARALLTTTPRPSAVYCQTASARARQHAPFGHTRDAIFTCRITISAMTAAYAVELLPNRCFVAEQQQQRRALYGCERRQM